MEVAEAAAAHDGEAAAAARNHIRRAREIRAKLIAEHVATLPAWTSGVRARGRVNLLHGRSILRKT